jgi:hypothetical protein
MERCGGIEKLLRSCDVLLDCEQVSTSLDAGTVLFSRKMQELCFFQEKCGSVARVVADQ